MVEQVEWVVVMQEGAVVHMLLMVVQEVVVVVVDIMAAEEVPVVKVVVTVAVLPSPIWTPLSKVLPVVKVIVPAPVRLKRRDRTPGTMEFVTAEASILPNE